MTASVSRQTARIAMVTLMARKRGAVVAVQAALGGQPDKAEAVLEDVVDRVLRQPIALTEGLKHHHRRGQCRGAE